ncbi:hypothetical protein AKJ16_DCAP25395 [Drosera capensis]
MNLKRTLKQNSIEFMLGECFVEGLRATFQCWRRESCKIMLKATVAFHLRYWVKRIVKDACVKFHSDHPVANFFSKCTELKIKLDRCFGQEKALKRKASFEESKKLKERLQAY